jgi:FkbM family methyltransferase
MTYYWDKQFLEKIDHTINIIFEVGARYGDETLQMSTIFPNSKIYSFECNPNTLDICKQTLENRKNIFFMPCGLGNENEQMPFYSYMDNNDGASSFFRRIDYDTTQKITGWINIKKICDIMKENKLEYIDLLCMDVQGFELNVLKGAEEYLKHIKYIIMEEPKPIINTDYLPPDIHSKYIGAPTSQEIKDFMTKNNFYEIVRLQENMIEDNVMYKNKNV